RKVFADRLELSRESVHVRLPVVRLLAVRRGLRVTGAAREVRRAWMIRPRERSIADAVAVDVLVATERSAELFQPLDVEHLAAIERLRDRLERIAHPVVHAEVEVGHDEHERLQPFGEVERFGAELETLFRIPRKQERMPAIAVRKVVRLE